MSKITEIVDDIIVATNSNTTDVSNLETNKLDTTIIHDATSKTTPVDADELAILDSTSSFSLKKLTWSNLKTILFGSPALTGTPTAPTAAAGTNTTQIATTAFVKAKSEADSIGVNQTWQNVTASRSVGVTYTNTTGKPIVVRLNIAQTANSASSFSFFIAGVDFGGDGNSISGVLLVSDTFIIPNGAAYYLSTPFSINSWLELR